MCNDQTFSEDGAKVVFLMSDKIMGLPLECRSLHSALSMVAEVGQVLSISGGIEGNAHTREFVRAARASLAFGKKTVNVSAAVRLVFASPINKNALQSMLTYRDSLPNALVRKMDELVAPPATTPSAVATTSGTAASCSATDGALTRAALRRSKSAAGLGTPAPKASATAKRVKTQAAAPSSRAS